VECPLPQDTTGGCLCVRRSEQTDLFALVGSHSICLPQGQCFTDFWAAYSAVVAEEQHTAVGKETGETAQSSGGITRCGSVWPVVCA